MSIEKTKVAKQVITVLNQLREATQQSNALSRDIEVRLEAVLPVSPPKDNKAGNPDDGDACPLARDLGLILDDALEANYNMRYILEALQL